jgi:hypothetical protein
MDKNNLPEPNYIYGKEEAERLATTENTIEAKGPMPLVYSNIKKAQAIVLDYRDKNKLGTTIQIMPNPNLGKMKNLDITLGNAICPFTGIYFGRYMGMRNDTHVWTPVNITSIPRTYDLEKENDLADWMVIRLFKNLKGSHFYNLMGEKPFFYIKDEKSEMLEGLSNAGLVVDMIEKVKKLNTDMLLMVARQLGLPVIPGIEKNLGYDEISGFVLRAAIDDPKRVLEIVSSSSAAIQAVVSSAIYGGIIFQDHMGFTYKGNLLGRTNAEVIATLQADSKTFQLISVQSKSADKIAIRLEKEVSHKKEEILPDDEDEKKF